MPHITPTGNEFLVNTVTTDSQISPVTTALADGRFIVVWVGSVTSAAIGNTTWANADIRAQIYNDDGSRSGNEFVVNSTATPGVQFAPVVTELADGHILIAWQDGIGSVASPAVTPAGTIRAREFAFDADSLAQPVGAAFQIGASAEAILPAITAVAGGGFFAAWQQGRSGNVVGQVYDASNATVGSQFTIDSTALAPIASVRLATLTNGNVAVAWQNGFPTNPSLFSAQVYSASGTAVGTETSFSGGSVLNGGIGNLIALASGGFAVSDFILLGAPSQTIAEFNLFFPDGSYGTQVTVAVEPFNTAPAPRIAPTPNGGLVVTWTDFNMSGSQPDIFAQAYNGIGETLGQQYILNTTTGGAQVGSTIAALSTGDLIVVWRDDSATGGDTSGSAIRARLIDYDSTNTPPVAGVANVYVPQIEPGPTLFDEGFLTQFATDADGDTLHVTAIANVTNGTAVIEAGGDIRTTQTVGAPDAVSFDYTVSDGNGGSATARARIVVPTDYVTLRGANEVGINFLANDYLLPRLGGYSLNVTNSAYTRLIPGTGLQTTLLGVNPFGGSTAYYDLLVGQTQQIVTGYVVGAPGGPTDYIGNVVITLQGWAQIGGTGRDVLIGSALADSLQGGGGAANELYGFAGDDFYTVRVQGDTIVERVGEGTDTVRLFTNGTFESYTLAANVENLENIENANRLIIAGNGENNRISVFSTSGAGSVLSGGDGNDTLNLGGGNGAELIGGRGDDTYEFSNPNFTVFENLFEGIDTVRINNSYTLPANVENLTYTGSARWTGTGNALANTITGGTVAGELVGLDGNDTYVVRNVGDTIVEAAGGGTDTVQTALSFYRLNAANVENLTFTGTGNFTGIGNALDNVITGGAGADYLFAGAGADTLVGGAGADVFLFDQAVNGIDAVSGFVSGSDRLFFNQTVFTHTPSFALVQGAGAQLATSSSSTFLLNGTTGLLSFDADGTGAGAAIDIVTLSPGVALTQADLIFYG